MATIRVCTYDEEHRFENASADVANEELIIYALEGPSGEDLTLARYPRGNWKWFRREPKASQ